MYVLPAAHKLLVEAEEIVSGLDADVTVALEPEERATLVGLLQRTAAANGLIPGIHPGLSPPAEKC